MKMNPPPFMSWLMLFAVAAKAHAEPTITKQPLPQSVSLGATATFQISAATSAPPIRYQWRLGGMNLKGEIRSELSLTNIQPLNEGNYDVIVSDNSGSITSKVAHLEVDVTFTKITTGSIVNDMGASWSCAWGDYDNDGFLDLFVTNGDFAAGKKNFLYHNNRDGSFTRITDGAVVNDVAKFRGCSWVDFDNDGRLDLSIVSHGSGNFLYRNNGDGSFTKITNNSVVKGAPLNSIGGSWADYDRDGYLDFFVANANNVRNFFYHNDGFAFFTKIITGRIATDIADGESCAWADYDNDGYPDLFVTNFRGTKNFLYHNQRDGTFARMTDSEIGSILTDSADAHGCAWGDYNNDGFLDLYVANGSGLPAAEKGFLYRNQGNGSFARILDDEVAKIAGDGAGCAWGDYDNDGFLDLFVANIDQNSYLFHNNGDGTFTRITSGSVVNDGAGLGCSWGDYDNDGFLDLFVTTGGGPTPVETRNLLYRNNGNKNNWLKVRARGTISNRSAIGAKIRVKANIGGKDVWQLREVSVGDGFASGNPLEAHFGLGNAADVNTIRVEWPSGAVQTLDHISPNRVLTITEPLAADENGYKVYHKFSIGEGAENPGELMRRSDGDFFGVATGIIFKLKADGSGLKILRSEDDLGGALSPLTTLMEGRDGFLYGMTEGPGTIFKMDKDGQKYENLHSFVAGSRDEGEYPVGRLLEGSDGLLYGVTESGGTDGFGTVFRVGRDGSGFTILRHFSALGSDGRSPAAGVIEGRDGLIYGVTQRGGLTNAFTESFGTVFKLSKDGTGYTILKRFGDKEGDGTGPNARLLEASDGALYGTTWYGGIGGGTIFRLERDGNNYRVLHRFEANGWWQGPHELIERSDGYLYGTHFYGGTQGGGILFRIGKDGSRYTVLHDFLPDLADTIHPMGGLIAGADGTLYGTTLGGISIPGTMFMLRIPIPVPPKIVSLGSDKAGQRIGVTTTRSAANQLQRATAVQGPWAALTNVISRSDGEIEMIDPAPIGPKSFYRVMSTLP